MDGAIEKWVWILDKHESTYAVTSTENSRAIQMQIYQGVV